MCAACKLPIAAAPARRWQAWAARDLAIALRRRTRHHGRGDSAEEWTVSDDGFDRVFLHCSVQLGLADEQLVATVNKRLAANDFRPAWLIMVDAAGLSFDQIDRVKSEVAKFRKDCPRCQKPRFQIDKSAEGSCPHCAGGSAAPDDEISQQTFVPVNLDDSPDPHAAPLDDHWHQVKEDWET